MKQSIVSFGLVGLGHISQAHLVGYRTAVDSARIVAVCDSDPELAKRVGKQLGASVYTNYRDLVNDPRVEAVDVALPHNLHYEVAHCSLSASKHVLLEKPMAPTESECNSLIALAHSRGATVSVAENARFVAAYTETEKLLRSGGIGEPRLVRTLIYGSEVVIARLTGDESQASVHLLNYSARNVEGLRVRVRGVYRSAKLSAPGAPLQLTDFQSLEGAAEFSLPILEQYAVIDLR